MKNEHAGKVAFITGGNRGIGLETARELGKEGITVVIGSRDLSKGEEAARQLKSEGAQATAIHFDADVPSTHAGVYEYLDKHFGKLDILVNNAGVLKENLMGNNDSSSVSPEVLKETFNTNFFSVVSLTQRLLPLIRKSPAGRIVNVSSIVGSLNLQGMPGSPIAPAKALAYNASKTALNAFTVHLADELKGTGIKVNSAHPGWVKTELGGRGAPMEVAGSGKTTAELALLGETGRSGGFVHLGETLPW